MDANDLAEVEFLLRAVAARIGAAIGGTPEDVRARGTGQVCGSCPLCLGILWSRVSVGTRGSWVHCRVCDKFFWSPALRWRFTGRPQPLDPVYEVHATCAHEKETGTPDFQNAPTL